MQSAIAPLVSVIVPTHNRPELLHQALHSLAQQTLANWEAIVVDDGSAPAVDAMALTRCFGTRVRVLHHHARRSGAAAKNTGLRCAMGRLITFLDDDDLLAPQYLARAADVLDRHRDIDGAFMNVVRFGDPERVAQSGNERAMTRVLALAAGAVRDPGVLVFGTGLFDALLHSVPMAFQRVVVRREALLAIGEYEPDCLLWDCDWALRASVRHRFGLVLEPLYRQRLQGQGTSSQPARRIEHMRSRAEIADRLYRRGEFYGLDRAQRRAALEWAAAAWFDIAYYYGTEVGAPLLALQAWLDSQRRRPSLQRLKFLARLVRAGFSMRAPDQTVA
ncbi:MAG TPA: glycosyltransferase family 2 protein [Burkholderiales bacterium]|nr:glycosyltransferase family 2 protein [Burkholderiales bacterium]